MPPKKEFKAISTTGTGYFPSVDLVDAVKKAAYKYAFGTVPVDTIRQRLYENIYPSGYNDALRRVHGAVVENKPQTTVHIDYVQEGGGYRNVRSYRDNIYAQYLLIPKEKRHNIKSHQIVPSKYRPTKGDLPSNLYFKIAENTAWNPIWDRVYRGVYDGTDFFGNPNYLKINENAIRPVLYDVLGKHTLGRGYDDRGEYMSYADVWDLSPYGRGGEHDLSAGIGKPVHIYDRMYLDDYFGVSEPTHATYLPEIIVKPLNKKNDKK